MRTVLVLVLVVPERVLDVVDATARARRSARASTVSAVSDTTPILFAHIMGPPEQTV